MKIKGQCVRSTTTATSMEVDAAGRGRKSAGKFGKREEEGGREPSPPTFHKGMERKELFGPKLSGGREGGKRGPRERESPAGGENEQNERGALALVGVRIRRSVPAFLSEIAEWEGRKGGRKEGRRKD